MEGAIQFGVLAFSSLFAMVNPISAAPIFVNLTKAQQERRRQTAIRATMTALIAMVLFAFAGTAIFSFFGITVPAFQIVGGMLFAISSIRELQGIPEHETTDEDAQDPSIVPIGIPLIAGAGALSTVMVLAGQARDQGRSVALGLAILLNAAITLIVLILAPRFVAKMGGTGQVVMTKLMGLLTAVIGVQFVINGLTAVVVDLMHRR